MTQQDFGGGDFGAVPRRFSVGGVIGASLPMLRRNFWQFFAIAFVVGIPLLVLSLLVAQLPVPGPGPESGAGMSIAEAADLGATVFSVALAFIAVLTYFAIQSAINYAALQDLHGERPAVARCISRGLATLPQVFAASLLLFLAIFGLTFVAVFAFYGLAAFMAALTGQGPGAGVVSLGAALGVLVLAMYLFVSWWVFVPAIVVESAGPVACFGRSRRLTKGHRGGIFGIVLLVFAANFGCSIAVGVIGQSGAVATAALLNVVVALAFSALSSVLTTVGYYALRAEKENFGLGDLGRVFE